MVGGLKFKAAGLNRVNQFLVAVHFAVAVGHASKVKACGLQGVGFRLKALLVPTRLQNVNERFVGRGLADFL